MRLASSCWHYASRCGSQRPAFLVGERVSVADVALFAYTHRGEECGLDLAMFPAVVHWIERIQALPRFVAMVPPLELKLVD